MVPRKASFVWTLFLFHGGCYMNYHVLELQTSRCIIRGMELADACDIYAYMSQSIVCTYLELSTIENIDDMIMYMQDVYLNYMKQEQPQCWCIEDKQTTVVIGQVCFYNCVKKTAYLECILHPSYWGQGIMREVILKVIQEGFSYFNFDMIYARCHINNQRMRKLLDKCGFQEYHSFKQTASSRIYYISKKDWRNINENIGRKI